MVESFLGCFPLKSAYFLVGILYCFLTIICLPRLVVSLDDPINYALSVFYLGNLIVFGIPSLYWALDQIRPDQKYKQKFQSLYFWLTLIWEFLIVAFFGLVLLGISAIDGASIDSGTGMRILLYCSIMLSILWFPTIYIAKCIKAYIEQSEVKPASIENGDGLVLVFLESFA